MLDDRSRSPSSPPGVHPPVAFLDRTYAEAMALTRAARDYVAVSRGSTLDREPVAALTASVESMRLTSRVVQIMAWCLAQKAIFAGELVRDAATIERFALSGGDVCLGGADEVENESLPQQLRALLARSHALYVRVLRLDELMHRDVAARA